MSDIAIRGEILDLIDDPTQKGEQAVRYFEDGLLHIKDGIIQALGDATDILPTLPANCKTSLFPHHLIIPGMIDCHVHYPQTEMIAAYGEQLLTWLTQYTFPTEQKFNDPAYCKAIADFFIAELLKNGTTTAMVFATVHPEAVDALFAAAKLHRLRLITGKVMMDQHCPDALQDTPETAYFESKALIEKWHGVDRLSYAVTPRFAPTSSSAQLEKAKQLLDEFPSVYLQTHLSENKAECEWVRSLHPDAPDYLSVYESAGLVRRQSVFAHALHLSEREWSCLANNNAAIAHCPTSNLFIGSGLFNLTKAQAHNIHVGMGTDVGAGTSFSLLQTYNEAYKVQQLQGKTLSAYQGLYLNTLGGARALGLETKIGSFNVGNEADFIALDFHATPLIKKRIEHSHGIHDKLFALMMLGDDRVISHTYLLGKLAHKR